MNNHPALIRAMDKTRLIGCGNVLWQLPADMAWFRKKHHG